MNKLRLVSKTDCRCAYCGNLLTTDPQKILNGQLAGAWSIDHMTPIKKGGSDNEDNLILACFSCNQIKRDRTVEEYREWIISNVARHLEVGRDNAIAHFFNHLSDYNETAIPEIENIIDESIEKVDKITRDTKLVFYFEGLDNE